MYFLEPNDDGTNEVTQVDYYLDPEREDVEALESLVDGTGDAVTTARINALREKWNNR